MSFKYKFILSFVILEVFFILLIISINFVAINNSSSKLINEKIESNLSFFEQLLKVPLSIYDIATMDNLVEKTDELDYINTVIVLDNQNRVVSSKYEYIYLPKEEILKIKSSKTIFNKNKSYEIRYKQIYEDNIYLGSFYIIFDTSSDRIFIENNKKNTIILVFLEIILSTLLAFFLGKNLTSILTDLSLKAYKIGKSKKVIIPYLNRKDELGILANSMNMMQEEIAKRRKKLKAYTNILKKQRVELIQANKAKDDFLANMSHELKTPLNSINIISSIMMKNKNTSLNEQQVKNLKIINDCGKNLLALINDILDISKLEAKELKLDCQNINLCENMEKIKDMFLPQIEEKGLNINYFCKIESTINSDITRINQILINLLSNAIKFTHKGTISFIIEEQDKDIKFTIEDEGIGIPKDEQKFIFERFKQVDSSTTRKYYGTGLGLAISKELVALLNGKLILESQENIGTKFIFFLPKKNSCLLDKKEVIEIKYNNLNNIIKEHINSVLIFSKEPLSLFSIVIELKKMYEVIQVGSMQDFFDKMKKNTYTFVIIDSYEQDLEKLKEVSKFNTQKFILVSSNINDFNINAEFFCSKPIIKEKFFQKLKEKKF